MNQFLMQIIRWEYNTNSKIIIDGLISFIVAPAVNNLFSPVWSSHHSVSKEYLNSDLHIRGTLNEHLL